MVSKVDETPTTRKAKYAMTKGQMIGEGAFRQVFRTGKSKWVYKVDCNFDGGWWGTNAAEISNYTKFRKEFSSGTVRFPEMHLMENGVIAAEYVDGEYPAYCTDWGGCTCQPFEFINGECWLAIVKRATRGKFDDVHSGNVKIGYDGFIYIIDLGA